MRPAYGGGGVPASRYRDADPYCEGRFLSPWFTMGGVRGQWQLEAVWKSMLHYESLQRYYTFLGERLARRRRVFSVLVLTASSSAAAVLLAGLSLEVSRVLALVVMVLAFWAEVAGHSAKSVLCLDVAADLGHLAAEMQVLWFRIDEMDVEEAERAWRALNQRATVVTRRVPPVMLGHRVLQDRAESETYGYWSGAGLTAAAGAGA
ncbi:MAG: hypothetical protein OXN97_11710 [Bryobacterales bacterium]|nr:hypothetical protein [Bryobacterales bacterium]